MPAKDRIGGGDARYSCQDSPTELPACRRKTASLIVGQPEPPIAELFLENSVLLPQVFNGSLLLLVDLAGEDAGEELPWLEDLRHRASVRMAPVAARLFLDSAQD